MRIIFCHIQTRVNNIMSSWGGGVELELTHVCMSMTVKKQLAVKASSFQRREVELREAKAQAEGKWS